MTRLACLVAGALVLGPAPAAAQLTLRARVTTEWGSGEATRCVPDVAAAFARMPARSAPLGFHLGAQPPLSRIGKHWQGVARLAVGEGRWLVASRSGADSAIAIVHMASRAALPGPWGSNRLRGGAPDPTVPAPPMDRVVHSMPAEPGIDHGGGLQAVGGIVVVPYESRGDSVRVVIYDLANPLEPRRLGTVAPPEGLGELTHASLAALARLEDGRWLLVVGGPSAKRLLYLRSRDTVLAPGRVAFDAIGTQLSGLVGGMQALTLVPQCDGRLFAIGFHNTAFPPPSMGRDHVHWYELTVAEPGVPRLVERGERHFDCDRCNLGGGAGAFVAADGTLILYALGLTAAGPDDTVPLAELAPARWE